MWSRPRSACAASAVDNTSFTSSLLLLFLVVGALACLPWLVKRWQSRLQATRNLQGVSAQVLASVAVGPSQRVVTVEVGQGAQKTCLVLGVTAQSIHCLHVLGQPAAQTPPPDSFAGAMAQAQEVSPPL